MKIQNKCNEIFEEKKFIAISKDRIAEYKKKTKFSLNDDMIYVIENYGGVFIKEDYGFIGQKRSPFADENGYEAISFFFDFDGLLSAYETYKTQLPKGYLPIAEGDGGNLICINRRGHVYIWLHDEDDGNCLFLANKKFADFILSIKEIPSSDKKRT